MGPSRTQSDQLPKWVLEHHIPHRRRAVIQVKDNSNVQASLKREFYRLLPALRTTRVLLDDEKQTAEDLSRKWSAIKSFASPTYREEGRLSELARSPAYKDPAVAKLVDQRVEEEALCKMALLMCERALSPERKLVPEVLLEIFRHLAEENTPTPYGPGVSMLPALVSASQVCSRWRGVALGYRSLWRKVHVVCDSFSSPELAMKMVERFYTDRSMDTISLIISDTDRWNDDDDQRSYYLARDITLPRTTIGAFLRSLSTRPDICARVNSLSFRLCKHSERIPRSLGASFAASLVNLEAFATSRDNEDDLSQGMENRLQDFLTCLANPALPSDQAALEKGDGGAEDGAGSKSRSRLRSLRLDHALLSHVEVRQLLSIHTGLEDVSLTVGDPTDGGEQQLYPDMAYDERLRSLRFTFSQDSECGVDDILKSARIVLPKATSVTQIGGKEREREKEKRNRAVLQSPTGVRQTRFHPYGFPRAPRRND